VQVVAAYGGGAADWLNGATWGVLTRQVPISILHPYVANQSGDNDGYTDTIT